MADQFEGPLGWARVYAAMQRQVTKHLRHGTWYPIVRDELPDRISLKVGEGTVEVPRRLLEIRARRPTHFTVVNRLDLPPEERSLPGDLGARYAVCPKCSNRTKLQGQPSNWECPKCGYQAEVGWWES